MVRMRGLEPPHLAILVPETSASTNSATSARRSVMVRLPYCRQNKFARHYWQPHQAFSSQIPKQQQVAWFGNLVI